MASTGLNLQQPGNFSPVAGQNGAPTREWQAFFHTVGDVVYNVTRSGPTASRPTSSQDNRWVGMPYFDTTLGKPIFLKSVNPDVWVDGSGAAV